MRVFLDANVIFSAAHRETGSVRVLFDLADAGLCELVSSAYAVAEARRNVANNHPDRLADLEALLSRLAVCREANREHMERANQHRLPAKDVPILAAAMQAGAGVLVTGDRTDFGHLFGQEVDGTLLVVPPADAIRRIIGKA